MRMLRLSHMGPVMETVKLTCPVSGLQLMLSVEGETSIPSRSDLGEVIRLSSKATTELCAIVAMSQGGVQRFQKAHWKL